MKATRVLWRTAMVAAWCLAAVGLPGPATAGPPFRTDDPEPVEHQHFEFYTFTSGTHIRGDTSGVGPAFEFNYGLIPNGQFHIVAPVAFDAPAKDTTMFGYGDTELGFKYRFIQEDEEGWQPMVGTFPMLELPTGNQKHGLGTGHTRLYLPLWVQKSFGDKWTTYGGGGYWINHDTQTGDRNYWYFGWLLQKQITDALMLGGEIYHQTISTAGRPSSTGINLGGVYDFTEHDHLLFSAGRGVVHAAETNGYSWYLAYQMTY